MSNYNKEKELQSIKNKIDSNIKQTGFLIRNIWKVIAFGIYVSFWAPTYRSTDSIGHARKSAFEFSDLNYYQIVLITAILYTVAYFVSHFIWSWQDRKVLKKLLLKKEELEEESKN